MKKKIIFGFLCLLSLTNVNASEYKEPISSIVKDNTLYVDVEVPTNEEEFANVEGILNEQYKDLLQDSDTSSNQSLYLTDCSDNYSICYVVFRGCSVDGNECGDTPIPDVSIKWKENYSETFNKIAPNGVFEVNAIAPTNDTERSFYVYSHLLNLYPDDSVMGELSECNTDNTRCTLTIYENDNTEVHEVSVKWQEANSETKKAVDSYIQKIESTRPTTNDGVITYELSDLNKINYLNHMNFKTYPDHFIYMHQAIKYSPEAKDILGNNNYDYVLIRNAVNDEAKILLWGYGTFTLYHEGVAYGIIDDILLEYKNVIYIPADTEDTKEAYIAAAKKRIDEYLGNTNSKIEVAGKRDEYSCLGECYSFNFAKLGDESKMGDYYYNITIGNVTEEFAIVKDSSKIEAPSYDTKDTNTNVVVSSTSSEVPLDTIVKVEVVDTVSEIFTKINEVLKLDDKEEVQVYDIKLFSESSNKYITKLANGEFKVSVPIKDSLKGKQLVAYYVNDKNEKEVHDVTVVDGIATFTTNHFSIYTIAEKVETPVVPEEDPVDEPIPPTGDRVMTYVTIGMIGLVGLGTGIVLRKREN